MDVILTRANPHTPKHNIQEVNTIYSVNPLALTNLLPTKTKKTHSTHSTLFPKQASKKEKYPKPARPSSNSNRSITSPVLPPTPLKFTLQVHLSNPTPQKRDLTEYYNPHLVFTSSRTTSFSSPHTLPKYSTSAIHVSAIPGYLYGTASLPSSKACTILPLSASTSVSASASLLSKVSALPRRIREEEKNARKSVKCFLSASSALWALDTHAALRFFRTIFTAESGSTGALLVIARRKASIVGVVAGPTTAALATVRSVASARASMAVILPLMKSTRLLQDVRMGLHV